MYAWNLALDVKQFLHCIIHVFCVALLSWLFPEPFLKAGHKGLKILVQNFIKRNLNWFHHRIIIISLCFLPLVLQQKNFSCWAMLTKELPLSLLISNFQNLEVGLEIDILTILFYNSLPLNCSLVLVYFKFLINFVVRIFLQFSP